MTQRPIKFRAWDGKEWYQPLYQGGGWLGRWRIGEAEHPIVQFTGLHDRDGREIYEGDIVRVVYDGSLEYPGGDDEVREVIWGATNDEYYPAFDLKGHDINANALSVAKNNGDIEVIGNVYENVGLLK